jgi:cephalosporin hydroxylase
MARRSLLHLLRTAAGDPVNCRLAYGAIRNHYAVQSLWELTHMLGEVRRLRPVTIVEIGTHRGGTLYCWSRILPAGSTLVSLDLPADPNDTFTTVPALEKLLVPGRQKCVFIRDDSHAPATLEKVRTALNGKPVDFLFVDGDHSYEGVRQDFEMYSPLARDGGLVAFHDVAPNPDVPEYGVAKYWRELRETRSTREYIDPQPTGPTGMGIGIVDIP